MSDYKQTRDAAGNVTTQYDKMLRNLDDDLVERARLAQHDERMATGALYGYLADRIEELEERLEAATEDAKEAAKEAEAYAGELEAVLESIKAKLASCEKYRDAYAECDRIGTQSIHKLEAKLAKAVEWVKNVREYAISWDDKYLAERSNEIIAELTSSEAATEEGGKADE